MKQFLFFISLWISTMSFAQRSTVQHVVTHNRTTIICDSKTGTKSYIKSGVFPSEKIAVRKIMMNVTLGRPDTLFAAHWDYLDHIKLHKKDAKGSVKSYELGRMLTPYGSIYNNGWSWKWKVDVTDFASLLRDEIQIEYIHTGYESKSVGWSLTIDFEITEGPAVADVLGITPLWNEAYKYGNPKEKIEDNLLPISFESIPNAAINRIRIQHTGHGMDKRKGCSEFCSRWREIKIDGKLIDHRDMWKDCGGNPLYPQGGTWIIDRAYWCPGELQLPDVFDVKSVPGKHIIALEMEPYTTTENSQAVENISAYLFQYSAPKQKNDVAVDEIMVPTNEQQYTRLNPASFNPYFVIRNVGAQNLRSVIITYGTEGFPKKKFRWKGNLKFNETAEIVIPGEINSKAGINIFTVSVSQPNGTKDAWLGDNEMISEFAAPTVLPNRFVVQYLTNNQPEDNKVFLLDKKRDTIYKKLPSEVEKSKMYRDTITLKDGKYDLCLTDKSGDGLEFWYKNTQGDGSLRLFDLKGNLLHAFESDCGNGEKLSFEVSSGFNEELQDKCAFSLFPRLITDKTELNVVSNKLCEMTVLISIDGVVYEKHEFTKVKNGLYPFSLNYMPSGRIIFEVLMNGVSKFKCRLNKK